MKRDTLYLGVGRTVITPKIGAQLYGYSPDSFSNSVRDDLTATAFFFTYNDIKALMISCTVCLIQTELNDSILEKIEKRFDIPMDHCQLCATHTHSGPNVGGAFGWGDVDTDYCENIFIPRIMEAVEKAIAASIPVTMGYACGNSDIGINRREMKLAKTCVLGQNPWGSYNPEMTVLAFRDEEGKHVAAMVHYGCHCTCAGNHPAISRDWAGVMVDSLEAYAGGIAAFFNGPEGDVGPRQSNGKTAGPVSADFRYVYEIGYKAGMDAVRIFRDIRVYRNVSLSAIKAPLLIPVKPRMPYETAVEEYEKLKHETVNFFGHQANHYREVIDSYNNGYEEKENLELGQVLIKIGDIAFAAFPYELFSEVGLRIRKLSPVPHALSLAVTNGSGGYFISQDQWWRGGYEVIMYENVNVQPYADHADTALVVGTLENLKRLANNK